MTPRELITAGECTPACLAAVTTSRTCRCPCGGVHHGAVADADITRLLDARAAGLTHLTDLEVLTR